MHSNVAASRNCPVAAKSRELTVLPCGHRQPDTLCPGYEQQGLQVHHGRIDGSPDNTATTPLYERGFLEP